MSESPASTGARLKGAREQRSMSVQKAAGELHLEAWMVESLEAGDLARIGPPVYGKGFLRRYAMLLDLPAEEILAGFGIGVPVVAGMPEVRPVAAFKPSLPTPQVLGGVLAVVLLAALVWWKPWSRLPRAEPGPAPAETAAAGRAPEIAPDAPQAAREAPAVVPVATPPHASPAVLPGAADKLAGAGTTPAEAAAEPGAGRARLRLSFTADSWVDVRDAQGNKSFVGNGSANTVRSIAGQAPMHVYLRWGSGVQLEINGHAVAIGPQFFAGDVARFQAGADGVLRREPPRDTSAANSRPPG